MVGSAIARECKLQGHQVLGKPSKELNFTDRAAVFAEFKSTDCDALVIAAAKVGGIGANVSMPVDFLSVNLQIQTNLLDAAHTTNIRKVLFLGSSCIYPKHATQPIPESELLTTVKVAGTTRSSRPRSSSLRRIPLAEAFLDRSRLKILRKKFNDILREPFKVY